MQHINKIRTLNWLMPSSRLRSPFSPPHLDFLCFCPPEWKQHTVKPLSRCSHHALESAPSSAGKIARGDAAVEPAATVYLLSSWDYFSKPCSPSLSPCLFGVMGRNFPVSPWTLSQACFALHSPRCGQNCRSCYFFTRVPSQAPRGLGMNPSRDSLPWLYSLVSFPLSSQPG